jgi:hypothetical protein
MRNRSCTPASRLLPLVAPLLVAALLTPVLAAPAAHATTRRQGRTDIVGGGAAAASPGVVAVFVEGEFNCSGTILSARKVLTSSHCLGGRMSVRAASMSRTTGGVVAGVTTAAVSPGHDLAILTLDRRVSTAYARLAGADPRANAVNRIYGFGATSLEGPAAVRLKAAAVRVRSTGCADARLGQAICSDSLSGAAWRGDSGGPQVDKSGRQVGVLSLSNGVTRQVASSIAANRAWIRRVAGV